MKTENDQYAPKDLGPLFDVCKNFHRGNEQSIEANKKVDKHDQRSRILRALKESWYAREAGLTCEMLEETTSIPHQSCSARISELKNPNQPGGPKIKKVGTRPTRSGCMAAIYQAIT